MTAADWIDNLARWLAKAAQELTPGEWVAGDGWVYTRPVYDDDNRLASVLGMKYTDWDRAAQEAERAQRNAKFIAAANPATVLRLIEAARRAEDYNAEAERHAVRVVALEVQNEDLTADRDALAAKVAAVEALADRWRHCGDPGDPRRKAAAALRAALSAAPADTTKET